MGIQGRYHEKPMEIVPGPSKVGFTVVHSLPAFVHQMRFAEDWFTRG